MNDNSEKSPDVLAKEVRVFFSRGAHDLQNLFHSMRLWMDADLETNKALTVDLLNELEAYYTTRIDQLRQSFEEFESVRTNVTPVTHVNVADLVTEVIGEMSSVLNGDVVVKTELDTEATLRYAEKHLRHAVRALMDNAWRYRNSQKKSVITIRVSLVEERVRIAVQDNGVGIDMDRHGEQLFQPFVRSTSHSEGQGISLHLVKLMVEKNGGSLEVISQLGKGTTVTLHLIPPQHKHNASAGT